jgi:redox-sensitive bicupin YhaK (pirin superfamily)
MEIIAGRTRDLGDGFVVKRVLPFAGGQFIGPWLFFDEMGPAVFAPGTGFDVRPHPHIGLATVTYLFEGEILHRDSLGIVKAIEPGAVNWMTAGRGIVHSERTSPEKRISGQTMHGIQTWVALSDDALETDPSFTHYPASDIPSIYREGADIRIIIGDIFGAASPVKTLSLMFYAHVTGARDCTLELPAGFAERGVYALSCGVRLNGETLPQGSMAKIMPGDAELELEAGAQAMLLGGDPVGPRYLWWNFVYADPARLEIAKRDWETQRFPKVAGESDFIPLPGE